MAIGFLEINNKMKFICHVTSRNGVVRATRDFVVRHVTPSHKLRENESITFFILCDHVINRLCDFVDNRPALGHHFVGIGLAEIEI